MRIVTFKKKDGTPSSIRITSGSGDLKISSTSYFGSNKGGTTFKIGGTSTRFSKGQVISSGMKLGRHMSYVGKNGRRSNHIAAYK